MNPRSTEEALRESHAHLADIIGSAMDAIISVDEEQRIILFNASAERMFLYPADEAIGQPLDLFIPKRFRMAHREHIENFGKTHVTKRRMGALGAVFGLRADGKEFPIEASISYLETEGRKIYTVILRDIAERRQVEESLRKSEERLHTVIENLTEGLVISDLDGTLLHWNRAGLEMHGFTSLDEGRRRLPEFDSIFELSSLDGSVLDVEQWPLPRIIRGEHLRDFEVHIRRLDTDWERIFSYGGSIVHDASGKPLAFVTITDITERKRAEDALLRLNEELEQRVKERTAQLQAANSELEAFSYSVSHDLRAPLRHINGFSQAVLEDYSDKLDEEGKSYLQELRNASREMAHLIDDLLQLARVSRGEMHSEVVNLSELAHEVIAELQKNDAGRKVTVEIEEGLSAAGDRRLLKAVLVNLLGNAWKFTSKREQALIRFGHERQGTESVYVVSDNGAGFEMAYAEKLFGAFQRLHTSSEFEGTGIGLATVQRIIHRHGGRVWAEGKVNEGATFYFTLANYQERGYGEQSNITGGR